MMTMTATEQDGVVQISLSGRMDLLGVEDVGAPFTQAIGSRAGLVAVDLSRVDFLASVGLRLLFTNARTLQEHGGRMALSGAQDAVKAVLDSTGVPQVITHYPTLESACDGLRNGA